MQLAFGLVRIIYGTITSVLFWAFHFCERMILWAYDLWAYDLSGRMIFSEHMICVDMICLWVWFVCVGFCCAYDCHDDPPVLVAYRKNSNKLTMYSDFLNVRLWQHGILLLTPTLTWECAHVIGRTRVRNRPGHAIPHPLLRLYRAFSTQSMVAYHSLRYTLLTWHLLGMYWPLG